MNEINKTPESGPPDMARAARPGDGAREESAQQDSSEDRQARASALLDAVETDAVEYGYGLRQCVTCGKMFHAVHFAQICCSDECKKERKKRRRQGMAGHLAKLQARVQELETKLAIANDVIEKLGGASVNVGVEKKPQEPGEKGQ